MNTEQRKFKKVMKARKRRAAYLRNGKRNSISSSKIDFSKFINSLPKQIERKEGLFQRMKRKIF